LIAPFLISMLCKKRAICHLHIGD